MANAAPPKIPTSSYDESEINWIYSNNSTFTYTTSSDLGLTWDDATIGNCGALSVWAEYIYEEEVNDEVISKKYFKNLKYWLWYLLIEI